MLFMVIERFNDDDMAIYRHLRDVGRSLPEGVDASRKGLS